MNKQKSNNTPTPKIKDSDSKVAYPEEPLSPKDADKK